MTLPKPWAYCENVVKSFGQRFVLTRVTFGLIPGEVLGLAGPNGAGKTTLARILAGFIRPTSGTVSIEGTSPSVWRARHGLGYLPEELPRPWACTVAQLLGIRACVGGAAILDALEVARDDRRTISKLSKGQWRLVLTAYAMMGPPRLIILDEPDAGMDPDALDRIRASVKLCAQAGSSVLILSHHLHELEAVCRRVLFVKNGALVAEETRDQFAGQGLLARYREIMGRSESGTGENEDA